MFKITSQAQRFLLEVVNREKQTDDEELFVRISMGLGWGEPKLNLSLEERKIHGDLNFMFEGLTIIIHERDFVYFDNFQLDYVRDGLGNGRFQLVKI